MLSNHIKNQHGHSTDPSSRVADLAFVGRQPVYDRLLRVVGYELLFRRHDAPAWEGDAATAQVVLNAFLEIGLETVAGSKPAYLNFTRSLLLQGSARLLPAERVVIEVLEDVEVDERLRKCLQELALDGYTIAVDDFVGQPHLLPLIDVSQIVKIDLRGCPPEDLDQWVSRLRRPGLKLLAEKVETRQEFEHCKELGFDCFQGFFLRRPEIVEGRRRTANQVSVLRLLERLNDPRAGIHDLERLLSEDLDLSYQLVRLANSALVSRGSPIVSLGQALLRVGLHTIMLWASLCLLSGLSAKPADVLQTAILRATMCKQLAEQIEPASASTFFLAGLFSALDILLDMPMEEVLQSISLSPGLERALLAREGLMGEALQAVLDCEQGLWDRLDASRFDNAALTQAYLDAVAATEQHTAFLGNGDGPQAGNDQAGPAADSG